MDQDSKTPIHHHTSKSKKRDPKTKFVNMYFKSHCDLKRLKNDKLKESKRENTPVLSCHGCNYTSLC